MSNYDGMILASWDANAILDCPMLSQHNSSHGSTIRQYLCELLIAVQTQGEDFSSKRPFGNSGWEHDIYAALISGGFIDGSFDSDGYIERLSRHEIQHADELLAAAVWAILGGEARDGDEPTRQQFPPSPTVSG